MSGNNGSPSAAFSDSPAKKKACKARKTRKARKACRKRRQGSDQGSTAGPGGQAYEPTVVAPIRQGWFTGTPASAPSRQFGYACRIVL